MPYISIALPTMRVGGLDVVFNGLAHQSYKDFELIISDGIYDYRKDAIVQIAESYNFPIKHIAPIDNPFPLNSFCRYANTALAHANGEVVLFITDYTWLQPDCVKIHADFHKTNGVNLGLMSPHRYLNLPKLNRQFRIYAKHEIDRYVSMLNSGELNECQFSIFEKPYDSQYFNPLDTDPIMGDADPKLSLGAGSITPNYFHGKNESCKLKPVIDINGWDEDLDEAHCYQDSDISDRLTSKAGVQWMINPLNIAHIINPRHVFPFPRRLRPIESNKTIWESKRSAGYPPVNKWNIGITHEQMKVC